MKKIVILAFAIFNFINLKAQNLGIHTGASFSNIRIGQVSENINPNTNFTIGYFAGLYMELGNLNGFSFRPEVNYIEKGFESGYSTKIDMGIIDLPIGASLVTKVNYLEMPLLVSYKKQVGKFAINGVAGPSIAYALAADYETSVNSLLNFNVYKNTIDLNNKMANRWDIGANVGLGASTIIDRVELGVQARYIHGFKSAIGNTVLSTDVRNSTITTAVSAAYKF